MFHKRKGIFSIFCINIVFAFRYCFERSHPRSILSKVEVFVHSSLGSYLSDISKRGVSHDVLHLYYSANYLSTKFSTTKVQCVVQFFCILIGFKGRSIISIQQWIEMSMKEYPFNYFYFSQQKNNLEYKIMVM